MKVLFLPLVSIFLFVFVAEAQSDIKLKIGAKLPNKYVTESDGQIATHPNTFRPFIKKKIDNVQYTIAFEEKSRKIRFIHTTDKSFQTKNGLRVGSEISLSRNQLSVNPIWYIFAPTTSDGWRPIINASEESLSKLKDNETKTFIIGGFIKGGN